MSEGCPDPRPRVAAEAGGAHRLLGSRCTACGHPNAVARPRCPVCGAAVEPAAFGPEGRVWSATVVRVPLPDRAPPTTLAYVDLVDGPRFLARVRGPDTAPGVGTTVRLCGSGPDGDALVELVGERP